VVAHFHYVLSLGAVYSLYAACYHYSTIFTNYFYNELFAKAHFIALFISSNLIFLPMHLAGIAGHPRRIADYLAIYYKLH
jgi:cytochrome c oxidase subunit 1